MWPGPRLTTCCRTQPSASRPSMPTKRPSANNWKNFEAHKSREIAEIEAEMERIRAHYAQRIQKNRDQIAREKETLRNWQMAMQHESQRISEVIELCGKQPAATASP